MSDNLSSSALPGAASAATPTPDRVRNNAPANLDAQVFDIIKLMAVVLIGLFIALFSIAAYYIATDMSIDSAVKAANAQHTIGLARGLVSPVTCLPVE
jgi:membrane associated rhomboid family serine protease